MPQVKSEEGLSAQPVGFLASKLNSVFRMVLQYLQVFQLGHLDPKFPVQVFRILVEAVKTRVARGLFLKLRPLLKGSRVINKVSIRLTYSPSWYLEVY